VHVGDLGDFERLAEERAADLLITTSHGRQAAERLGLPLYRVGFPVFDRLGAAHRLSVGYQGTRDLVFDIANVFLAEAHEHTPEALDPFRVVTEDRHARAPSAFG